MSTLIAFVMTLGIVIIIHELGHFAVCKWTGIYVKTFSIGFGPKLLRRRFGETEYALSIVPFGGYVKMAGEGVMEEIQDTGTGQAHKYPIGTEEGDLLAAQRDDAIPEHRHFRNRPAWQRLAVVAAGPVANLVLAFVIYTATVLSTGNLLLPVTTLGTVEEGSAAAAAGLMAGDRILSVDGVAALVWRDVTGPLAAAVDQDAGTARTVRLQVERDGAQLEIDYAPALVDGSWTLGFEPADTEVGLVQKGSPAEEIGLRRGDRITALDGVPVSTFNQIAVKINDSVAVPVRISWLRDGVPFEATVVPEPYELLPDSVVGRIYFERNYVSRPVGLVRSVSIGASATWRSVTWMIEQFRERRFDMDDVGGPIRIGQVAGEMLRWSLGRLMQFIAFFSVNLFLLNLLPIPVLDGGHILFILYEMILRRQVPQRIQAIATQVGLIVLLLFMTFIIVKDVLKIIPGR